MNPVPFAKRATPTTICSSNFIFITFVSWLGFYTAVFLRWVGTLIVRVSQLCLLRSVRSVIDGNKSFDQKPY